MAAMNSQMRTKDDQISDFTAQVATLSKFIKTLTTTITCLPVMQVGGRGGHEKGERRRKEKGYTATRNLGGYSWTHGYDPVGENHCSKTGTRTRKCHKKEATGNNKMEGSIRQPKEHQYNKEQIKK